MERTGIFDAVAFAKHGSNMFDLSHDVKMSGKFARLIPIMNIETLPSDRFQMRFEAMFRLAPMTAPVMHKIKADIHVFFVPNRIIWAEWEDWVSGKSVVSWPYTDGIDGVSEGDLGDYLGLPTDVTDATMKVSVLPAAAYAKIYDEYYRDQNLITEVFTAVVAGDNTSYQADITSTPLKRAWVHDYFTSALSTAQFGASVTLPLVADSSIDVTMHATNRAQQIRRVDTDALSGSATLKSGADGLLTDTADIVDRYLDPNASLVVDFTGEATDITTVRRAFKLQQFLEALMRGGRRFTEYLSSIWGERSSDARLQRPEYIGGQSMSVVISEVLSTAETRQHDTNTVDSPIGTLSGHGISVGSGRTMTYKCKEHGIIMAILSIKPDSAYHQGLHRKWFRDTYLDYAIPYLANIGEQEVYNKEVYAEHATPDGTFGYQQRYGEYKYESSRVHGAMRSTLDHWHLGRKFSTDPALNQTFIEMKETDFDRIFAVASQDQFYAHLYNNVKVIRKLPKFGIPSL